MLIDLVHATVLPRHENGGAAHVGRVLQPVLAGLSGAFPRTGHPALLVSEDNTYAVIKAIGLVVLASDADDVQVVLT